MDEGATPDDAEEPVWLTFDDIVDIHHRTMRQAGESPRSVIDEGRLRSKLTRPVNAYHYEGIRDAHSLAAMVAIAISQAHGFEDGNKRTAFASMILFLRSQGYSLRVVDETAGAWLVTIAEAHDRDRDAKTEEFATWLRQATSRTS